MLFRDPRDRPTQETITVDSLVQGRALPRDPRAVRTQYGGCQTGIGLSVTPRRGDMLVFYNHKPNSAEKDFSTWLASCDVTSEGGKMYAANLWLHLLKAEEVMKKQEPSKSKVSSHVPLT